MSDWAAKYEALKKERMEKEQAKKNKNLGFSSAPLSKKTEPHEVDDDLADILDQIPEEVVQQTADAEPLPAPTTVKTEPQPDNTFSVKHYPNTDSPCPVKTEPSAANSATKYEPLTNVPIIKSEPNLHNNAKAKVKTESPPSLFNRPGAKRPLFTGSNESSSRPSQQKDANDPWFKAYEARKAAAIENVKNKNLQSVAGATAFCGKIEGVDGLTAQNQVTKLMRKLKKDEKAPKVKFMDKQESKPVPSTQAASSEISSKPPTPGLFSNFAASGKSQSSSQSASSRGAGLFSNYGKNTNANHSQSGNEPNNRFNGFGPSSATNMQQSSQQNKYRNYGVQNNVAHNPQLGVGGNSFRNPQVGASVSQWKGGKGNQEQGSAFKSRPPPPPSALLAGSSWSRSESSHQANSSSGQQTNFSSPENRPGRPSVPTPGRYGTKYGGAPSPGPNPSKAFKPEGFIPPTPPHSRNQNNKPPLMKNNINPPPLMSQQINPPPHHNNPSTNRHNPPSHNKLNGPGPGGSPANRFHGPDSNFSGNNSGNFSGNYGGNFTGNNGGNFGQNRPASGEPRSAFVPPVPRANGSQATRPPPPSSAPAAAAGIKRDKEVSFMQSLRDVKADSKKDSDSWQNEYEARKRARLQGKS